MSACKCNSDLQLVISPDPAISTSALPEFWTYLELARRLKGDGPPLAGYLKENFLVRDSVSATMARLQASTPWCIHRIDDETMFLTGENLLVTLNAQRRDRLSCQLHVEIRTTTGEHAQEVMRSIRSLIAGQIAVPHDEFAVLWAFRRGDEGLTFAFVEEVVESCLVDAAYPALAGGVYKFIDSFLNAPECVLVLQGPPGTGKTQLIRAIAAAMSRRNGRKAHILYSNDERVLSSDEFFVKFAVGETDAMVLEDADQNLMPRSRGNSELHRMLSVSDGLFRAQGRKMIFSTNLPNLHDLDDALVRPGRCYARVQLRALTSGEANRLLVELCFDHAHIERARLWLQADARSSYTVADVYKVTRLTATVADVQPGVFISSNAARIQIEEAMPAPC